MDRLNRNLNPLSQDLHILIIPSSAYLPPECLMSGIFERDQALILRDAGYRLGIIDLNFRSLRYFCRKEAWIRKGFERDDQDGIPTYHLSHWNWFVRLHPIIAWRWVRNGYRLFRNYMKEMGKPDIIHCHNSLYSGFLAHRIKSEFGIPYIVTEHSSAFAEGIYPKVFKSKTKDVYRYADDVLVVSPKLGEFLTLMFEDSELQWKWVPNVVARIFEKKPLENEKWGDFVFLSVGNLDANKNHVDLINAFAYGFRKEIGVRLKIAGDGPLLKSLIILTKELDISDQVEFLGYLNRAQILKEMDRCDTFILSSHYETFGVVLIEALSRGKPIIATACGGPECIVDRSNGILCPVKDINALKIAMRKIYCSIGDYDKVQIRSDCLNRFGEGVFLRRISDVYDRVEQKYQKKQN